MMIDSAACAGFLKANDNYIIVTHAHADGDTLGSGFALMAALQQAGKKAKVVNEAELEPKFSYMLSPNDEVSDENAVVVAVDIASPELMGRLRPIYGDRVSLCIDHHPSNLLFAEKTFLNAERASNCENVYEVIKKMGVSVTPYIASCLFTGISTDTGCFRYSNTGAETHAAAAELLAKGADGAKINKLMFESKKREYYELERLCLENMKFLFGGKVALITITNEMYKATGTDDTFAEAITSIPRQIEGVLIGVTVKQRDDRSFKASFRTEEPYDAGAICALFGGGGHKRAAGCTIKGTAEEVVNTVVSTLEKVIK